jgi:Ser/Thr protein kinase RdoA (MazF antagonist)
VIDSAADPGLPHLARALTAEAWPLIRSAARLDNRAPSASDSQIELVKHVPGQRATILYSIESQTKASRRIIGKLYRSGRRAARMFRWLSTLNSDVFRADGRLRVPPPIGRVADLRMVLHEYIDGVDLRYALDHQRDHEPFKLAARWLARLHTAHPLDELKVRTVEHEIGKSLRWLDAVQPHVSPELQARLTRACDRLSRYLAAPPAAELCTIHRDYYYANLLWDGERIWAIDLDQLRIGDPALDVGHFLAHLDFLAYRDTGAFTTYTQQGEVFLAAYREAPGAPAVDARLPLYRAYTFLKLAATEVRRARPGWRESAEAVAGVACQEIERLP